MSVLVKENLQEKLSAVKTVAVQARIAVKANTANLFPQIIEIKTGSQ